MSSKIILNPVKTSKIIDWAVKLLKVKLILIKTLIGPVNFGPVNEYKII